MLETKLLLGPRVILRAESPQAVGQANSRWDRDSKYMRLAYLGPGPLLSPKFIESVLEKEAVPTDSPSEIEFYILTRADERLVGNIGLSGISWQHGDCFMSIGIGDRNDWGQGYGTEATELILAYAFDELNLHRVTLNVFDYNERAVHVYEKAGFRHEGRKRGLGLREGRRFDVSNMGILREEWLAARQHQPGTDN